MDDKNAQTAYGCNEKEAGELAALLERMQLGDARAEQAVVAYCQPKLKAWIQARCNERADGEDFVNEVWLRALPKLRAGELRAAGALCGYLKAIAHKVMANTWRKRDRRATDTNQDVDAAESRLPADPEDIVYAQQLMEITLDEMDALSQERDRRVLGAFYFDADEEMELRGEMKVDGQQMSRITSRAKARLTEKKQVRSVVLPALRGREGKVEGLLVA